MAAYALLLTLWLSMVVALSAVQNVLQVLQEFEEISGLAVSKEKTKFYTSCISPNEVNDIETTTGLSHGCLPIRYLGLPLTTAFPARLRSREGRNNVRVAWETVTAPKSEGGLGLKDLLSWNKACSGWLDNWSPYGNLQAFLSPWTSADRNTSWLHYSVIVEVYFLKTPMNGLCPKLHPPYAEHVQSTIILEFPNLRCLGLQLSESVTSISSLGVSQDWDGFMLLISSAISPRSYFALARLAWQASIYLLWLHGRGFRSVTSISSNLDLLIKNIATSLRDKNDSFTSGIAPTVDGRISPSSLPVTSPSNLIIYCHPSRFPWIIKVGGWALTVTLVRIMFLF
ncbi:unnamed protein product [Cochlearia groenlandica]